MAYSKEIPEEDQTSKTNPGSQMIEKA